MRVVGAYRNTELIPGLIEYIQLTRRGVRTLQHDGLTWEYQTPSFLLDRVLYGHDVSMDPPNRQAGNLGLRVLKHYYEVWEADSLSGAENAGPSLILALLVSQQAYRYTN